MERPDVLLVYCFKSETLYRYNKILRTRIYSRRFVIRENCAQVIVEQHVFNDSLQPTGSKLSRNSNITLQKQVARENENIASGYAITSSHSAAIVQMPLWYTQGVYTCATVHMLVRNYTENQLELFYIRRTVLVRDESFL